MPAFAAFAGSGQGQAISIGEGGRLAGSLCWPNGGVGERHVQRLCTWTREQMVDASSAPPATRDATERDLA
jgi:hypothetical protein